MKSAFNRSVLAFAAIAFLAGAGQVNAQQKALKSYQSGNKEFWTHPPDDWFLGDETEAQKGLAPPSGPATGASDEPVGGPEGGARPFWASVSSPRNQSSGGWVQNSLVPD